MESTLLRGCDFDRRRLKTLSKLRLCRLPSSVSSVGIGGIGGSGGTAGMGSGSATNPRPVTVLEGSVWDFLSRLGVDSVRNLLGMSEPSRVWDFGVLLRFGVSLP